MTKRTADFARVLSTSNSGSGEAGGDKGPLQGAEIDSVIELAYLMANADGSASFDELDSFRQLVNHLRPEAKVADLLDSLGAKLDKAESIEERVRAAAKNLARPTARELGYKAAYTIAIFDLETNEDERDLDDLLVEVLGLSGRVDELEAEVNEALTAE